MTLESFYCLRRTGVHFVHLVNEPWVKGGSVCTFFFCLCADDSLVTGALKDLLKEKTLFSSATDIFSCSELSLFSWTSNQPAPLMAAASLRGNYFVVIRFIANYKIKLQCPPPHLEAPSHHLREGAVSWLTFLITFSDAVLTWCGCCWEIHR